MSLGPLYILFREVSVQVLCALFNLVVCLAGVKFGESFIYFGDQTLVRGIIDKYIFPCGWFPINIADFTLAMQKLCILMKSHLFILSFMSLALEDILVKILLCGISEIFLPMFSCMAFMVSQLIFKSFLKYKFIFEFIFVYGVSW